MGKTNKRMLPSNCHSEHESNRMKGRKQIDVNESGTSRRFGDNIEKCRTSVISTSRVSDLTTKSETPACR
jgi:hypothetical protein